MSFLIGLIAQWIEHPPSKRVVAGSNPAQSISHFYDIFHEFIMIKASQEKKVPVYLGDFLFPKISFPNLDTVFKEFDTKDFLSRTERRRFRRVNQILIGLLKEAPQHVFLLPAVVEFIDRINHLKILRNPYHFSSFEFWLNHFSELNDEENYIIRSKIVGKLIPRDEYQAFFPIGMDKVFSGTHFVAAHLSPDVDTMVASFWGWVDAFGARVGNARHLWSLPGGPPDSPVTKNFIELFGASIFSSVAYTNQTLTLSAIDLVTQKGLLKKTGDTSISSLDLSSGNVAVIHVDENGHYVGDWHRSDVDPVRQIIIRFKSCLRWFENNLHVKLISLFVKKELYSKDIKGLLSAIFDIPIADCEPAKEFLENQKKDLNDFLLKVVGLKKGLNATFRELIDGLAKLSINELSVFQKELESLETSELFDENGKLKENRPVIFNRLEKIINQLDTAIHYTRDYAERLDVAIQIKTKVFGQLNQFIMMESEVEDIRVKMQRLEYLTVVIPEGDDKLFPVGVVWANGIQRPSLGTITFRDFCNQEEVKMAPYFTVISVIDHHKASLKTSSPPLALIGDAQSCNVLIAEMAFKINDLYSSGGMTLQEIEKQIKELDLVQNSTTRSRLLQQLLKYRMAVEMSGEYFIHPEREIAEYICFLHAILDDTDLLTKVSRRDIECVVKLLNRIKSLTIRQAVEVVDLNDLPKDKNFVQASAKRILRNAEMYSLYRKVYESKEKEIEQNLETCVHQINCGALFADTKEQNGCNRVGQTKMFTINFPTYRKHANKIREYWFKNAVEVNRKHPEIDLHLHMISTIASAEEVYLDKVGHYKHQDELWFWVPPNQKAYDHLASFLTAFHSSNKLGDETYLEFFQPESEDIQQIFYQNFRGIPIKKSMTSSLPIVVLYFGAGLLNSRKAMITPYLPKIIS